MKIFIGSDHAGFELKNHLVLYLRKKGVEVEDLGTDSLEISVDYPDFAARVARAVVEEKNTLGIVLCGTGIGASIAANKVKGIRAALCHDSFTARLSREHNDANVLALGGRVLAYELAYDIVETWLNSSFKGERHIRRIEKISKLEEECFK